MLLVSVLRGFWAWPLSLDLLCRVFICAEHAQGIVRPAMSNELSNGRGLVGAVCRVDVSTWHASLPSLVSDDSLLVVVVGRFSVEQDMHASVGPAVLHASISRCTLDRLQQFTK